MSDIDPGYREEDCCPQCVEPLTIGEMGRDAHEGLCDDCHYDNVHVRQETTLHRLITIGLILLGLVIIGLGWASLGWWVARATR